MNHSSGRIPLTRWLMASAVLILLQLLVDLDLSLAEEASKNAPAAKSATKKPAAKSSKKTAAKPAVETKETKTPAASTASIPQALLEIEKAYQKAATLEAAFTQISNVAMTGAKKESSGVVMVQRPNKFRWETLKPEKNLLVSDGSKYWFYTPPFEEGERGQVVEKKSKEVQSELANQLLSGAFSKMKTTKIEDISENRYRLTPAPGSAGTVKTAEVEIEPKKSLIQKVKLIHEGGNVVEIILSDVKLGPKIDGNFFSFYAPPGTDVIRE